MGWTDIDPELRSWFAAFVEGLAQSGWADGVNVRIEQLWMNADAARARAFAKELMDLQPDVILTGSTCISQRKTIGAPKPALGPGCVKTKSDLVVTPSGE
jgi:ABC-type uncharacterized transport system substrate-binding protein